MSGTRYEDYTGNSEPFVFHPCLKRTPFSQSREQNWHDDIELQLCLNGEGNVLLDGRRYPFKKGDIVVANSNVIHYTATDGELYYACMIVRPEFFKRLGIDIGKISFESHIKSDAIRELMQKFSKVYTSDISFKSARLIGVLVEILVELCENHSIELIRVGDSKILEKVKNAINCIRMNYSSLTLCDIAQRIQTDKYALCRDFKCVTGQTVTEYLNRYRCKSAAEQMSEGKTVAEAAYLCGFSNLSYFSKTFKKYMGILPSEFKTKIGM